MEKFKKRIIEKSKEKNEKLCIIHPNGVFQDEKGFGIMNIKIGEVIREIFASYISSTGVYKILNRKHYGVVNLKTGEDIIAPELDNIFVGKDNNAIYKLNNKWGIIDIETGEKIKKEFADYMNFNSLPGIVIFGWGSKEGFIDAKIGEIIRY